MLIKSKTIEYVKNQTKKPGEFIQSDYAPDAPPEQKKTVSPPAVTVRQVDPREEEQKKIKAASEEAYTRGLAEGMIRGGDVEKKNLASAVKAFEKALREVVQLRDRTYENLEPEILNLAIGIAEKVIHREIQTNHEIFLSVLKEAVRNILDREGMKIRLNPRDYDYMLEVNPGMLQGFEGIKDPAFEKDNSLARGDVVIETLFGEVDARIESQLDEIKAALTWKG